MWKVEGIDCLAMYCVKDVHVNDVITFDHSAEIEVIFYLVVSEYRVHICSISGQVNDARADQTIARRFSAGRRTPEAL